MFRRAFRRRNATAKNYSGKMTKTPSRNSCIAVAQPAWQFAGVRRLRYRSARPYSALAERLLRYFVVHRTATANQVLRYFPQCFGTLRSVRMHLQTLAAAGDLEVVRNCGVGGPNIYLVTGRGLRNASDCGAETGPARRRRPSGSHLPHELLITEFATLLHESARQLRGIEIPWEERFGFHFNPCFQGLVPDYAFLTNQSEGQLASFVEVSSGEDSTTRLRQKLAAYTAWSQCDETRQFLLELYSRHGAARPRPQFRLLCIMHNRRGFSDNRSVEQLVRAATDAPPGFRRRIWCTTAAALATAGNLSAPIWIRFGDIEASFAGDESSVRERQRRLTTACRSVPPVGLFSYSKVQP